MNSKPTKMNERERFLATMRYKPVDRAPICDFGFWDEVPGFWQKEGLPEGIDAWQLTRAWGSIVVFDHGSNTV